MIYKLPDESSKCAGILSGWTLVDGSFDPIHHGHVSYFNEARSFGNNVACLIAPDSYTGKKHKILLKSEYRAIVLASIKQIDVVIYGEIDTGDAIELLKPSIFFKGGDWSNKLSQEIIHRCDKVGTEIKIGQPPIASSSKLLKNMEI